jgi:hypothetical protein
VFWCCVGVDWIANKVILLSAHTVHLCVGHVPTDAFAPKAPICIRHVYLSVRVSTWTSSTTYGRNSVKFGNGYVYKNLLTPNLLKIRSLETPPPKKKTMLFRNIVEHCAAKHFCLVSKGLVIEFFFFFIRGRSTRSTFTAAYIGLLCDFEPPPPVV